MSTTTIYHVADNGEFTGETREIGLQDGAPIGWTRTPVPEIPAGMYGLFMGGQWVLVDALPEPVPEIPQSVTRRQILTGLALVGWITEAEAEAALATGARPAAVDAVIAALPMDQQFHARMKWIGFRDALRDDPMVAALAAIEGKTEQDIDEFFALCAAIE